MNGWNEGSDVVEVELFPQAGEGVRCGCCGQVVGRVHDWNMRFVDDLPTWGAMTVLKVHMRRVECPACGLRRERIPWLDLYTRITARFAASICAMCEVLPIAHVAAHYQLGWNRVKRIHKQYLQRELQPVDLRGVTVIGMDEFAIHRGHTYATLVVDMLAGTVGRTGTESRRCRGILPAAWAGGVSSDQSSDNGHERCLRTGSATALSQRPDRL
jgi:transposase